MFTPRSSRQFVLGALACGALVATGCSSDGTEADAPLPTIGLGSNIDLGTAPERIHQEVGSGATNADSIDTVVMVGDSITKGSTQHLESQFAALGLESTIESENGKRMVVSSSDNPSGATIVEELSALDERDPASEVWVIALGTNDIAQYSSPDDIAAAVNEVLADVPDDAAVVWVDTYMESRVEQADALNAIVRDRVVRRGNAVVAPWASFATVDGVLTGDGVHPTSDGAEAFASVVTNTVRQFLGR